MTNLGDSTYLLIYFTRICYLIYIKAMVIKSLRIKKPPHEAGEEGGTTP